MKNLIYRLGIYIIGVISVSLGIVLCVKCELGGIADQQCSICVGVSDPINIWNADDAVSLLQ